MCAHTHTHTHTHTHELGRRRTSRSVPPVAMRPNSCEKLMLLIPPEDTANTVCFSFSRRAGTSRVVPEGALALRRFCCSDRRVAPRDVGALMLGRASIVLLVSAAGGCRTSSMGDPMIIEALTSGEHEANIPSCGSHSISDTVSSCPRHIRRCTPPSSESISPVSVKSLLAGIILGGTLLSLRPRNSDDCQKYRGNTSMPNAPENTRRKNGRRRIQRLANPW